MELRLLPPDLRRLDETSVELGACTIWSDERPMRGFAGLLDWRLGGRLSALLKAGFMRGDLGETLLVQGRPHVPFEKVLLVGLGPRVTFCDGIFQQSVERIAHALEGMRVRRAVIELPGRASGAIEREHAIGLALDRFATSPEHDTWWLVEEATPEKRGEPRAADERHRTKTA